MAPVFQAQPPLVVLRVGAAMVGLTTCGALTPVAETPPVSTVGRPRETPEAMGHVRRVDEASTAAAGPKLLDEPVTELAFNSAITVPGPVQVTLTVTEVPEEADGVNTHPLAVPLFTKSAVVSPVMASLKVNV